MKYTYYIYCTYVYPAIYCRDQNNIVLDASDALYVLPYIVRMMARGKEN